MCKLISYDEDMPLRDKIQISFNEGEGDLLETISTFKAQYDQEIQRAKDNYLTNVKNLRSKECHYNGVLKREFKSSKLAYYICRCDPGYLGDNCQLSKDMYFQTQRRLADYMNKLSQKTAGNDRRSRHIFLAGMSVVNKFKLSRQMIEQAFEMLDGHLKKQRDLDNRRRLFTIYDGLLLNTFDLVEDIQKFPKEEVFADSFIQQELDDLQALIIKIIDRLNESIEFYQSENSLLPDADYKLKTLNTHSFVTEEFNYLNYDQKLGFSIRNPNIDTSFHTIQQNVVWVTSTTPQDKQAPDFKLRTINFAAPLFERNFQRLHETLISNLMHFTVMEGFFNKDLIGQSSQIVKTLTIQFALTFLPASENVLSEVSCNGYFLGKRERWVSGTAISFNDDSNTVTCQFNVYYAINQFYFGVSIKSG